MPVTALCINMRARQKRVYARVRVRVRTRALALVRVSFERESEKGGRGRERSGAEQARTDMWETQSFGLHGVRAAGAPDRPFPIAVTEPDTRRKAYAASSAEFASETCDR